MFFAEGQIRVFLYGEPTDMRRSFDGLQALTRHAMRHDPLLCDEQSYVAADGKLAAKQLIVDIGLAVGDT